MSSDVPISINVALKEKKKEEYINTLDHPSTLDWLEMPNLLANSYHNLNNSNRV